MTYTVELNVLELKALKWLAKLATISTPFHVGHHAKTAVAKLDAALAEADLAEYAAALEAALDEIAPKALAGGGYLAAA